MNTAVMFSSLSGEWRTPEGLFKALDEEFHFTLDAAASDENHLCEQYYTEKDDALCQYWPGNVWLNPPYGRGVGQWVSYAALNVFDHRTNVVVMLLPARTDTLWFHLFVLPYAKEIRFIRGRLKFGDAKNSAPFPSMVVVFKRS